MRELPPNSAAADLFASQEYRQRRKAALRYPAPRLTERQMQVVALVHEGLSNKEIGALLGIGEGTIKTYMFRIIEILQRQHQGVLGRVHLALWWERLKGPYVGEVIRVA